MNSSKQCPECLKTCQGSDLFCPQCGHKFPPRSYTTSRRQCPTCGYQLGSFSSACPQCAQRSSNGALQQTAPPPLPLQVSMPGPVQTVNPSAPVVGPLPPAYMQCVSCRNQVPQGAPHCPYCGTVFAYAAASLPVINNPQAPVQQVIIQNTPMVSPYGPMVVSRPRKDKVTAGLLSLLLGTFGMQRFYLGQIGAGILSVLFCWTYIPTVIGVIEGIVYLCMDEQEFHRRHG